jgi:hypothetical protein
MQVDSLGADRGTAVAEITVAYPAPPGADRSRGRAQVQAIGFCAVRNGALSAPIDLGGPADETRVGEGDWLVRSGRARLAPGSYRCSFGVRDESTGITSYLTFERSLP